MTEQTQRSHATGFTRVRPDSAAELRSRSYAGELFIFEANSETHRLVDATLRAIDEAFVEYGSPRSAHARLSSEDYFTIAGGLRRQFYKDPAFHQLVADVIKSSEFELKRTRFDPARLRIVLPGGHENPAAAAMYYGHRDTWYANPQSMLTWWIPLHDVDATNSFTFFPECFERVVHNDSEIFNFDEWVSEDDKKLIGWQDKKTGLTARYPQLLEEPQGLQLPVVCRRGDLLLFSGQHLHRTQKHALDKTRFSLDFRTIDLLDEQNGHVATNTDNRSTGSWKKKFLSVVDALVSSPSDEPTQ